MIKIIGEWPFLDFFLSGHALYNRPPDAVFGPGCNRIPAFFIGFHVSRDGLQGPFADIAFFNGAVHGKIPVPVCPGSETVPDGYVYYLLDDKGTAQPVCIVSFRVLHLFLYHGDHRLEALSVIQPAQHERCRKGDTRLGRFTTEKGLYPAPECDRRNVVGQRIVFLPLFPVQLHDLPGYRVLRELHVYICKAIRAVIVPGQFPFPPDAGELPEYGFADGKILPLVTVCHQAREAVVFFTVRVLPLENILLELFVCQLLLVHIHITLSVDIKG